MLNGTGYAIPNRLAALRQCPAAGRDRGRNERIEDTDDDGTQAEILGLGL